MSSRDWSKLTVPQLKTECTEKGLDTSGKKSDLLARLEQHAEEAKQAAEQEEDQEEEEEVDEEQEEEEEEEEEEEADISKDDSEQLEGTLGEDEMEDVIDDSKNDEDLMADMQELLQNEKSASADDKDGEEEKAEDEKEKDESDDKPKEESENKKEEKSKEDDKTKEKEVPKSKFRLPNRLNLKEDRRKDFSNRRVFVGPLTREEMKNEYVVGLIDKAWEYEVHLAMWEDKTQQGFMQVVLNSKEEAEEASTKLKELKEDIHVKYQGDDNITTMEKFYKNIKYKARVVLQDVEQRVLLVHSFQDKTTAEDLQNIFTDAFHVLLPKSPDGKGKGYAWIEYQTQELAAEAVEKYKDAELHGEKIVFKKFRGSLEDELTELLEEQSMLSSRMRSFNSRMQGRDAKRFRGRKFQQQVSDTREQLQKVNQRISDIRRKQEKIRQEKIQEMKAKKAEEAAAAGKTEETKNGDSEEKEGDKAKEKLEEEKKDSSKSSSSQKNRSSSVQKGQQNRRPPTGSSRMGDRNRPQNRFPRNRTQTSPAQGGFNSGQPGILGPAPNMRNQNHGGRSNVPSLFSTPTITANRNMPQQQMGQMRPMGPMGMMGAGNQMGQMRPAMGMMGQMQGMVGNVGMGAMGMGGTGMGQMNMTAQTPMAAGQMGMNQMGNRFAGGVSTDMDQMQQARRRTMSGGREERRYQRDSDYDQDRGSDSFNPQQTAKAVNLLVGLSQMLSKTIDKPSRSDRDYDSSGRSSSRGDSPGRGRGGYDGGYGGSDSSMYDRRDDSYMRKRQADDDGYSDWSKQPRLSGQNVMGSSMSTMGNMGSSMYGNSSNYNQRRTGMF